MKPERSSERATLWDAYRRTTYAARTSTGEIRIHPDARHLELDALLDQCRAEYWAYLTAYNPGSRLLSSDQNSRRQQALAKEMQHRGLIVFEGESFLDPAAWPPEPSLLVIGLSPDEARSIGRYFGQLAVVVGRRGEPARLVACYDPEIAKYEQSG